MKNKYVYISLFSVSMAFLETAVVIYLRELLYPQGFTFPLAPINPDLTLTELLREASTLIMLLTAGILTGKSLAERFAWFLYSFAVWDIFYYIFLKLMIGWPESLMTWDILFLIPATWTGPVLTPILVSCLMILFAIIIISFSGNRKIRIRATDWLILIFGSLIIITGFVWDYSKYILKEFPFISIFTLPDKTELYNYASLYIPDSFPWLIFICGYLTILLAIVRMYKRWKKHSSKGRFCEGSGIY